MNETDSGIHSALVQWLTLKAGVQFIKANQSGPRPALPYGMCNFTGSIEVRVAAQDVRYAETIVVLPDPEDHSEDYITARPVLEIEWRYSLHAFGGSPTDILRPLRTAYHLAQVNEPLMPGVIIHEISQIRDVPEWVNEAWEPRAQMDFFLRGLTRDGFVIDVIEDYSFDITREGP